MQGILDNLTPLLVKLLIILIGIVIAYAVGLLSKLKAYLGSKFGADVYNRAYELAIGIYYLLEDEFKGVVKAGEAKRDQMYEKLREVFPSLTQVELESINKQVWYSLDEKARTAGLLEKIDDEPAKDTTPEPPTNELIDLNE